MLFRSGGALTGADANKFVCYYIYVSTDVAYPIYCQVGQAQHTTIAAARAEAVPVMAGLSTAEWKLLYRVIYKNVSSTPTYQESQDYRLVSTGPAAASSGSVHNSLIGRDDSTCHPITAISDLNSTLLFTIDGAGSVPTTGSKGGWECPFPCTINSWRISADASGSAVVDVKVAGTSIIGAGNKPTLSSQQVAGANVSSWTTASLALNDLITLNLDSVATCKHLDIQLRVTRT